MSCGLLSTCLNQIFDCYLQVLEKDDIMNRFQEVTTCLEQALGGIQYERLDISDEVKEQVGFFIQNFHFPSKETSLRWSSGIYLFFFAWPRIYLSFT